MTGVWIDPDTQGGREPQRSCPERGVLRPPATLHAPSPTHVPQDPAPASPASPRTLPAWVPEADRQGLADLPPPPAEGLAEPGHGPSWARPGLGPWTTLSSQGATPAGCHQATAGRAMAIILGSAGTASSGDSVRHGVPCGAAPGSP